jgi:nicotinamidase-related amidase
MTTEARQRLLSQPSVAPAGGFGYRVESLPRTVANIVAVIEHARAQAWPIAYLKAVYGREFDVQPPFLGREPHRAHYPCKPHTWGAALIEPIQQFAVTGRSASRERVMVKHTLDGFFETGLRQFLCDADVRTVVVVGVETHVCVAATATSASINQFDTLILEDCVWTANEQLGQGALAIFRDAFGATAHWQEGAPSRE